MHLGLLEPYGIQHACQSHSMTDAQSSCGVLTGGMGVVP